MKIDRLLAIIVMLLNKDRISAKELAEKFEVNIRTIYRDIDSINMAGIPIISYPGNNGGFGIMENFRISHQVLSLNEMSSIIAALKGINNSLENTEIDTVIEKIASLVPEYQKENFDRNYEHIALDINPWGMSDRIKKYIKTIHKAIGDRRIIKITYFDSNYIESERIIEPMTLILKGYSWYLFAFCCERKDFRTFKIQRIKSLKVREDFFIRKSASYKDSMNYDLEISRNINIKLKINSFLKNKMNEFLEDSEIEAVSSENFIIKFSFPDDDWTVSYILGLGEHAEVLEPFSFKNKIANKIRLMNKIYATD